MFSRLMAQAARFLKASPIDAPASPAATLMEHADFRAGLDAQYAQELRVAASAWLRVVR
jgi:hypothetical protein